MFGINKYLDKFSKHMDVSMLENNTIIELIKKHTNITIPIKSLEIKNHTLFLKVSPSAKNKVFTHKDHILKDFASRKIIVVDIK